MCRHNRLKGTLSDAAPILWQYGALARLKKGEPIDKLLYGGYSTISLGYAGLYECVKYMTGKSHTDPAATPFALDIMQHMNDACKRWKEATDIDFSLYGTPLESTTYKFAKCLQKRFGIVEGITDKNYITNSYHIHVTEHINAFDKLAFESQFQALSPGGAISYVEVPNMQNNIDAVLEVMKFIYDHIMYAAQTVQHRLLVTRNLRGKFGKRGKLLLGADLKQQLQPQKFPVEIAGKAEQRRFGHRLRQLVDRRVDAEIDRRGKPSKLPCVCPAAIDAEGRH